MPIEAELLLVPDLPAADRHSRDAWIRAPEAAVRSVTPDQRRQVVGVRPGLRRELDAAGIRHPIPRRRVEHRRQHADPALRGEPDDLIGLREVNRHPIDVGELALLRGRDIGPCLVRLCERPVEGDPYALNPAGDHVTELSRKIEAGWGGEHRPVDVDADETRRHRQRSGACLGLSARGRSGDAQAHERERQSDRDDCYGPGLTHALLFGSEGRKRRARGRFQQRPRG